MADQEGGIMQKIQTITAPPNTITSTKQRRTKQPRAQTPSTRQCGIDNRPYCEACADGGELLCCERCPSSFHFGCCDPPLDPIHLPEGEWVCQACRPPPAHLEDNIFRPLLMQCCSENPLVFSLSEELLNMTTLPDVKQERKSKQETTTLIKLCYICNKTSRHGVIISCDFCPLTYHMDCLTPPLTDKPIPSSWMCPNHAEHRISGLHDTKLTNRIEALGKCRAEISRQAIKMDFLKTLNKIPHYQRNTTRSNRCASDVPMAIKLLYNSPLTDSYYTPSLSQLLLTATEELQIIRNESEQQRKAVCQDMITTPKITTPSKDCDKWTRHCILSQTKWKQSTADDLMDILSINGIVENTQTHEETKQLNGFVETTPTSNSFIPDVSQLEPQLVTLLAEQRIRQLFDSSHDDHVTKGNINITHINKFHHQTNRHNQDSLYPLGILCPMTMYGPAHHIYKRVITIGSSSVMDISLNEYGHCNYVSAYHACLILDKGNTDNELINYSEHGSIVDGVLYSCDFSEKLSTDNPSVLLADDITARGNGRRAEKAKKRLETARQTLQDKLQASKVLSAACKLSKSIVRDYTPDQTTITAVSTGCKRRRSTEEGSSSPNGSPASSIVSIPLSKTKKTSNNRTERKKPLTPDKKTDHSSRTEYKACYCKRSASSLIGSGGKGWEGGAVVTHGSKLRFGCIQFVLSISNKPGYNELQHALTQHNLL